MILIFSYHCHWNYYKSLKSEYQPPTNSLDGGEREHDARLSLNVGVEDTKNVLKVGRHHQRHGGVGLLSETSTHSTISELLSRNGRIVHQEFFKGTMFRRQVTRSPRSGSWRWGSSP